MAVPAVVRLAMALLRVPKHAEELGIDSIELSITIPATDATET